MAKLNEQEIKGILDSKGLICLDIDKYSNLDTILTFKCKNNHTLEASIRSVRNAHFKCPECEGQASIGIVNNIQPPPKTGYRIVAIDNATKNAGVSIFDDNKLTFYHLYQYDGDTITRMVNNRQFLENVVIDLWQADMIVIEDIQYQNNNIMTFKTLAMLLGSSLVSCAAKHIKVETVLSKVWRSNFMIGGKTRIEQKKQAIDKVKLMYGIDVVDDIAEAILLGKYAVDKLNVKEVKKLF